ncbi:hypothetical protein PGH12_01335 [Chryseobacterium wangxinyae]|uniref:hypothetical protein n=1 Tax=Chryseobacterium sp. CY350 TaxID=2997336 RepID=UPI002270E258|nr:hypothetical protein [Chryseobacterium sp. CY350]MCY0977176.1 hypothetical protein [Chryseobacterium sp. CY350]WBZ95803.1 hypothetical protein PGH12_01335 [Chryseobacterium sp. CY350]
MDTTNFYKEIHFKEIERKHTLNNSFQLPILILTTLVTVNIYIAKQNYNDCLFKILQIVLFLNLIGFILCLFFLLKSFNNLFKNHNYKELANPNEIYDYEKELKSEKRSSEFEPYIKKILCEISGHNFEINKERTEQLANAKNFLFLCVILSLTSCVIYIFSII